MSLTQRGDPYLNIRLNALLYQIACDLLRDSQAASSAVPDPTERKYQKRYQAILSYMQEHYTQPITLSEAAAYANLSREYLSRNFKDRVGEGFQEHLALIRVQKAQSNLLESDIPLIDIAIKHGFSDLRSYNRAFQKHFGVSPASYRKEQERSSG